VISLMGVLPDGQAVEAAIIGHEGGIGLTNPFGSPVALSRAVVQAAGGCGLYHAAAPSRGRLSEQGGARYGRATWGGAARPGTAVARLQYGP
jgi:hypothetical protein